MEGIDEQVECLLPSQSKIYKGDGFLPVHSSVERNIFV